MADPTVSSPAITPAIPAVAASDGAGQKALAWWRGRTKLERYGRHILAILFWGYLIGQIFFDVDNWLRARLPPQLQWLIDYKALVFLGAAALTMNLVPRRRFWWWASFVLLWPLTRALKGLAILGIILFKLKSWPVLFAVLNLGFAIIRSFKINFLLYIAALIAVMMVLLAHRAIALNSAAIVLIVVTLVLVVRRLVAIFQPSPIFDVYVRAIAWVMDYCRRKVIKPVSLAGVDVTGITLPDLEKRYGDLSTAIMLIELCGFFQAKFREYRNSGMVIANYLLILATLFVLVVALLSFANLGIYRADPAAFKMSGGHSLFDFLYYTFGAISAQRSGEIMPVSLAAKAALHAGDGTVLVDSRRHLVGAILGDPAWARRRSGGEGGHQVAGGRAANGAVCPREVCAAAGSGNSGPRRSARRFGEVHRYPAQRTQRVVKMPAPTSAPWQNPGDLQQGTVLAWRTVPFISACVHCVILSQFFLYMICEYDFRARGKLCSGSTAIAAIPESNHPIF